MTPPLSASTARQFHPIAGFSLIEILVVLLIIMLIMGVALAIPKHEEREAQVRGAAEELAAVLRETRTRSMRENRSFAVVFNIENAPGSSGKILNNRSGGHWYRVLGPKDNAFNDYAGDGDAAYGNPPLFDLFTSYLNGAGCYYSPPHSPIQHYLNVVSRCWVDEPHRLAKGKVRFLALTDQDNGDNYVPSLGTWYTATYPRPWFGWWDAGSKELHTWGGYDPSLKMTTFNERKRWPYSRTRTIVNGRDASHSGFYYEGFEGQITGCVNPADRLVSEDKNMDGQITVASASKPDEISVPTYKVLIKDEPRPLINAKWVDYAIIFRPDGTVATDWFRLRQTYSNIGDWAAPYANPSIITFPKPTRDIGVGDMCNTYGGQMCFGDNTPYFKESPMQREATDYVNRTGYYWVSLAPDATNDNATFPSAEAALKAMLPLYRVGVSPDGNVKVIRVHTTNYDKKVFDTTITGMDWENKNKIWGKSGASWSRSPPTAPNYANHQLHNADGSSRGLPIVDVVMPEMLRDRKWWWFVP